MYSTTTLAASSENNLHTSDTTLYKICVARESNKSYDRVIMKDTTLETLFFFEGGDLNLPTKPHNKPQRTSR